MFNQFKALTVKRLIHALRNKSLVLSQLVFPIGILVTYLLFIKYGPIKYGDSPYLHVDFPKYSNNYVPISYKSHDNSTKELNLLKSLAKIYRNQLSHYPNAHVFNLDEIDKVNLCSSSRVSIRESLETYFKCLGKISHKKLTKESFVAVDFSFTDFIRRREEFNVRLRLMGYFNNQPYHIPPLTLNLMTNTLLKHYSNDSESSIHIINHPLPRNMTEVIVEITKKDIVSFLLTSGLTFGLSFLISSFAIFLINERESGAKLLQYLNGCNYFIFWLSAFCCDFLIFVIPNIFVILVLFVKF